MRPSFHFFIHSFVAFVRQIFSTSLTVTVTNLHGSTVVDSLPAAGTIRAKKKIPAAGRARAFDINPGSWKCLIFIILPVMNDKIKITKDGWPWD